MSNCISCGKELTSGDGSLMMCGQCRTKAQFPIPVNMGWICPVCGRGNSPSTTTCLCQPLNFKIT